MRLDRLLQGVDVVDRSRGAEAVEITAIAYDSRAVMPGALFCCVPGDHVDGHDFAGAAVAAGAAALLVERRLELDVPQVRAQSTRQTMPMIAANFYGHPADAMRVVGVTGTNGKTTTTHLLAAVFEAQGWRCGIIGTLSGPRTTPEAPDLQARLAELRDGGHQAVAMEVSSNALAHHRADAVRFAAAVFTNLSQDHLEHHHTMDAYFAAKRRLFEPVRTAVAVVNADDAWGNKLLASLDGTIRAEPYSMSDATDLDLGRAGSSFSWRGQTVELPMPGRFNVSNAIAAATTAAALDEPLPLIARGLAAAGPVPGRFELIDVGQPFTAVVDYAHTPDALEQLLRASRELADSGGRVLVVFGCGGDRDPGKRPLMGAAAATNADRVFLTSDNPRSEDPLAIIDQVRAGIEADDAANLVVEPDRAAAIDLAVDEARAGDVVVVAGKGHETGQEVAGVITPFDDRDVLRRALEARR